MSDTFWKRAEKAALGFFGVTFGLFIIGAATNDLGVIHLMALMALGVITIGGLILIGFTLKSLADWAWRLSEKQYLTFMFTWIIGWAAAGIIGTTLFENSILAVACFLFGALLAFSTLAIRILHIAKVKQADTYPIDGYGPGVKGP